MGAYTLWAARVLVAVSIVVIVIAAVLVVRTAVLGRDNFTLNDTVAVTSTVDGMEYRVQPEHGDAVAAANALATLNTRIIALMRRLKKKYVKNETLRAMFPKRARATDMLLMRYNPDNFVENSPLDPSGDTAYTLDKGAVVAICLRNRDPELKKCLRHGCRDVDPRTMAIQDANLLTFVTIHEMSHIAVDALDHPPIFWMHFKWLLAEADEASILYARECNYGEHPQMYCGMQVNYNPLYDPSTRTIT
ncbi:MAG: hypothetical protein KGL39_10915 [Patescibacteria group bacterium]|nr:hypothetical protein [Patescibacteria group bacterium]